MKWHWASDNSNAQRGWSWCRSFFMPPPPCCPLRGSSQLSSQWERTPESPAHLGRLSKSKTKNEGAQTVKNVFFPPRATSPRRPPMSPMPKTVPDQIHGGEAWRKTYTIFIHAGRCCYHWLSVISFDQMSLHIHLIDFIIIHLFVLCPFI